jgi:hypothetical protein
VGLTGKSYLHVLALAALIVSGVVLWRAHAAAWDLGRRSPVLSFDAAQYALAARELAEHGRFATDFALPIELARHARPPWPLAVVQPGLVVAEAAVFRLLPPGAALPFAGALREPHEREALTLVLPLAAFLALALLLAAIVARVLERRAPRVSAPARAAAAFAVGVAFLLDPEAQHFAVGGFTELPFTLGLVAAIAAVAFEWAPRRPLLFGLLLGITGTFRGNMLGLAPLFALAAAWTPSDQPRAARVRTLAVVLAGYAVVLAPWWIYKWRAFGTPGWDLSWYGLWDGAGGHRWFSLSHLPEEPVLPRGFEAAGLIAPKVFSNLWSLLLALLSSPRLLWIAALAAWLRIAKPPRALAAAGTLVLALLLVSLVVAALGSSWIRYVFPARVPLEAAGVLATWGLIARASSSSVSARARGLLAAGVAALAIAWGARQTALGLAEARAAADQRGVPSVATLRDLSTKIAAATREDEVVMSNLGPSLAWYARRRVLHLALTPADMGTCRARVPFMHVLLAFRDAAHTWPGWGEVLEHPEQSVTRAEWSVRAERHWDTGDGFQIVWLELGPGGPATAALP